MKTINYLSAFTLILLSFSTFGQDIKPVKKIIVSDVYIHMGLFLEENRFRSLEDFKTIASQSDLLNNIPSDFTQPSNQLYSISSILSVMVGIQFSDKQKTGYKANPLLRLGFNYSDVTNFRNRVSKDERYRIDTLASSKTGQMAFVDSIYTQGYGMTYSSEQIRFDGSLIFRSNPASRWSVYGGIGITAGISINAYTNVYYNESSRTETTLSDGMVAVNEHAYYSSSKTDNSKRETIRNKTNIGFSTYIPLGVDFRLGNKNEFLKKIHLFYEAKPALNFTSIPELNTIASATFQHGLGVRISWN